MEPCPFPARLGLFTAEAAGIAPNADRDYLREIGLSRREVIETAGFALGELEAPACSGSSGSLYVACDFSLYPVWLPALFDEASGVQASLCSANGQQLLEPLRSSEGFLPTDGPGFSGALACPSAGAAARDSPPAGSPKEVLVTEHVSEPLTEAAVQSGRQQPPERSWQLAIRAWRTMPVMVRYAALVVPLTVPALFYGPKISLASRSAGADSGAWAAAIKARASVNLQDDFQAGFAAWNGKPGWEKTWSIDRSGSAQPGRLSLYTPTLPLTDYRFEFQGQILAKGLSVALRAKDTNNYQAVKIGILKPGPLSSVTFTRYPVIDGREGPRTESAIPLTVQNDTLYKLVAVMQEDHFTVTVNGVFASAWTDVRFPSGGIGFFTDKGESARVRSIHVIDKDDFLGQLCYQVSQWTADRPTIGVKHE